MLFFLPFVLMKKILFVFLLCMIWQEGFSQYVYGTTGLLHMPTADMQRDKTFLFGASYLDVAATPAHWNYHTFNYYINITIFPWLEIGYTCTLHKAEHGSTYFPPSVWGKYCNQDRQFSGRLRIWKEGWWKEWTPQIVLGANDPSTNDILGNSDKDDYVHYLFCCLPSKDREVIVSLIDYCENHLVHFFSVPNVRNYLHHRMSFNIMGNVPYLGLRPDPLSWPGNRLLKRTFDIVVSSVFLCTLFPVILIVVAIVTGLTMPGPLFFRQKRNGLNGREFYCYKFRSMKVNADADRIQATEHDPRKTRWGNIMRKTNIDELPQFINVLLGDMSIVGPRPHMLLHTQEYSRLINKYMVRHFVKPGITGWSQVTGFRGETKELKDMEGRIRGDIWYLEHWSFGLDLYIMYRTVANVFRGEKNAY